MKTKTKTAVKAEKIKSKVETSVSVVLIEGQANIEKEIKAFATAGKKFDNRIHTLACSIINHIEKHGDYTGAPKMFDALKEAMPRSTRNNALKQWFLEYSKLDYNNDKKEFFFNKNKENKLEQAIANPFYNLKGQEGAEFRPLVVSEVVLYAVNRFKKAQEKGQVFSAKETEIITTLENLSKAATA